VSPASSTSPDLLAANLAALDEISPALATRLREPVEGSHLQVAPDGSVQYQKGWSLLPFSIPGVQLSASDLGGAEGSLLLFGLGAGEILAHVLSAFPDRQILAWDRDPSVLRLTLSRVEVGEALRSGRLRLLLGSDLLELLPLAATHVVIRHPLLAELYREELFLLGHPLGEKRAVICEGGLFVTELTVELQRRGFSVYAMHLTRLSPEEQRRLIRRFRPELIAAINYPPGLAELCAEVGCKLLCWEIDPAVHEGTVRADDRAQVFTFREAYVSELRAMGFRRVEQLPLAADPKLRQPVELTPEARAHYGAPVSFVGNSLVPDIPTWQKAFVDICQALGKAEADAASRLLEEVLAEQRADLSRQRLPEILAARCRGWSVTGLARLVRCASEIAAAERRVVYASRLGRFGLQVWGDPGWRAAAGAGVRYCGLASNFGDLNSIYCASQINLDIGRLHQLDIVTMRNFDVLACGGFVLAERSSDLEKLFRIDVEIVCYASLGELEQKVAHYLAHPEQAQAIATAGRRAVLERHTIAQRVDHMLARLA
jgi:spore maturation protein CgeB